MLILDEPTNHLDLESVEALIEGLNAFEGGVIVSTHDARIVEVGGSRAPLLVE